jgi:hypothetical protein
MIKTLRRVPYAGGILFSLICVQAALLGMVNLPLRLNLPRFDVQVVTGCALLACLSVQWVLFAKRVLRQNRNMRQHLVLHRWSGVTVTLLFAAHAIRMGHLWMSLLTVVFFLVALTGVLNREVLGYRSNLIYLIWLTCHIGLSAALWPLIGVHIWVALAYQ